MDKPKQYEDQIKSVFGYEASDLETNEAGSISRHQHDRLRRERIQATSIWTLIALLELLGLMFAIPLLVTSFPLSLVVSPLFLMLAGLIVAGYYVRRADHLGADMNENRAASVEGPVELGTGGTPNGTFYSMIVEMQRFSLKRSEFLALKNGDPYRVYYTPRSNKILAVEWLRDGEDNLI
ncbi:MAG TPA: hypothetical protein VHD90_22080 [Phototrophicaceae bacterium]|nr:hypothetical protein [Phototrophicaceae bacterium]